MNKTTIRISGSDFPAIPASQVQPGMRIVRLHKLTSTVIQVEPHGTQFIIHIRNAAGENEVEEYRAETLVAAHWPEATVPGPEMKR